MAWTQERAGSFRILFRFQGKQYAFTLGRVPQAEAEAKAAHVDYLLMRLKQGLVEMPPGVDVLSFVEHDGKAPLAVKASIRRETSTLGSLRDRYLAAHEGAQEKNTLQTTEIHFRHVVTTLGEKFPLSELSHASLQSHIDRRAAGKIKPVTIRKELSTFRAAWNWGRRAGLVDAEWPGKALVYKKTSEKPPFRTRVEIERQIAGGGLSAAQQKELWQALYLQTAEVEESLAVIQAAATHPWIYPMAATAAYTGARRSELIRMRVADIDFESNVVVIREKKRVRGRLTTRRVPLARALGAVLEEYLKSHPGGHVLFCHAGPVDRSKTRSPAIVKKAEKDAKKSAKLAGRDQVEPTRAVTVPLTPDEAHDHLRRSLTGSKWAVIRGWHIFRHSFVSACASKGIDQRLLQTWCGHMSAETSARYAHLYPSTQQSALDSVFG